MNYVFDVTRLVILSAVATFIAAIVGMVVILIVTAPSSFIALFIPAILISSAFLAIMFAAPVTFVIIPVSVWFLRRHPVLLQLTVPVVGLIGGGMVMYLWYRTGFLGSSGSWELFGVAGMISGLVAGAFYSRGLIS